MADGAVIEGERRYLDDGHMIIYSERYPNFVGTLPIHFCKSFTFYCSVVETSWSLRVTFQRVPIDGTISFLVSINRSDDHQMNVNAELSMRTFSNLGIQLPNINYRLTRVPPEVETTRLYNCAIPPDVVRKLEDRSVLFEVTFRMHGCHEKRVTETS